ncbi:MAG: deoxyribonuclease V [Desulfobacterales bacterium]|nr:deoxyribonuclease V [Desulfobacterales bacterium]
MKTFSHRWDLSPQEAIGIQKKLAGRVIRTTSFLHIETVAGIDISYCNEMAMAAIVVLNYPDLNTVETATCIRPISFPYIPGLLSFREAPVTLEAISRLDLKPDLLIFDGQGIAHPRRLGIASHIGLILDIPSIGCAKTRLCGYYKEPCRKAGSFSYLKEDTEIIGAAVRTRARVKPVFVSIGHRIDLLTGIHFVLTCCRGYRLPETTRRADQLARKIKFGI